jgi:hypothetical protein
LVRFNFSLCIDRDDAGECGETGRPRGIEIGSRGETAVELEDDHSVGERPDGTGEIRIAASYPHEWGGGAGFDVGSESFSGESTGRQQAVEMRLGLGEFSKDAAECRQRLAIPRKTGVKGRAEFVEAGVHEGDFDGGLVPKVSVERWGPDTDGFAEPSHSQSFTPLGVKDPPRFRQDGGSAGPSDESCLLNHA